MKDSSTIATEIPMAIPTTDSAADQTSKDPGVTLPARTVGHKGYSARESPRTKTVRAGPEEALKPGRGRR